MGDESNEGGNSSRTTPNSPKSDLDVWQTLLRDLTFIHPLDLNKGYTHSWDEFCEVKSKYEDLTSTSYVTNSKFKSDRTQSAADKTQCTLQYEDRGRKLKGLLKYDGLAYKHITSKWFDCHLGRKRGKKKPSTQTNGSGTAKKSIQRTKKKGCPSQLKMCGVIKFPEFKLKNNTKKEKNRVSSLIKAKLREDQTYGEQRWYFWLPTLSSHGNVHPLQPETAILNPVHPLIRKRITLLVKEGVRSVQEMKRHVEVFVRTELKRDDLPSQDRRFNPSNRDIRNYIYTDLKKLRKHKMDQKNLSQDVRTWKENNPESAFFFRESTTGETSPFPNDTVYNDFEDDDVNLYTSAPITERLLLCMQTGWQQRLLKLYGNETVFLDATYKTMRYSLPLFFLVIKTNVNYLVVGAFISQFEDTPSIAEALQWFRKENPEWHPEHFMTDYCEAEIKAIKSVFQETSILLCDFHREQAWGRWLKATKNEVTEDKDEIMRLLRKIARADTVDEFCQYVSLLRSSEEWDNHPNLRHWLESRWLPYPERWVWAYRKDRLSCSLNTNNGVERQHKVVKYGYLKGQSDRTLSGLAKILIDRFFPRSYTEYIRKNIASHEYIGKKYDENVPEYLVNRPKAFVEYCLLKKELAESIKATHVDCENNTVQSQSRKGVHYKVNFGSEDSSPSCECYNFKSNKLPCKHMFALLQHATDVTFESLPKWYRESPLFVLDLHETKVPDKPNSSPDSSVSNDSSDSGESVIFKSSNKVLNMSREFDEHVTPSKNDSESSVEEKSTDAPDEHLARKVPLTPSKENSESSEEKNSTGNPNEHAARKFLQQCREKMELIKSGTYLDATEEAAKLLLARLTKASAEFLSSLPQAEGLVLESKSPIKIKKSSGKRKAKVNSIENPVKLPRLSKRPLIDKGEPIVTITDDGFEDPHTSLPTRMQFLVPDRKTSKHATEQSSHVEESSQLDPEGKDMNKGYRELGETEQPVTTNMDCESREIHNPKQMKQGDRASNDKVLERTEVSATDQPVINNMDCESGEIHNSKQVNQADRPSNDKILERTEVNATEQPVNTNMDCESGETDNPKQMNPADRVSYDRVLERTEVSGTEQVCLDPQDILSTNSSPKEAKGQYPNKEVTTSEMSSTSYDIEQALNAKVGNHAGRTSNNNFLDSAESNITGEAIISSTLKIENETDQAINTQEVKKTDQGSEDRIADGTESGIKGKGIPKHIYASQDTVQRAQYEFLPKSSGDANHDNENDQSSKKSPVEEVQASQSDGSFNKLPFGTVRENKCDDTPLQNIPMDTDKSIPAQADNLTEMTTADKFVNISALAMLGDVLSIHQRKEVVDAYKLPAATVLGFVGKLKITVLDLVTLCTKFSQQDLEELKTHTIDGQWRIGWVNDQIMSAFLEIVCKETNCEYIDSTVMKAWQEKKENIPLLKKKKLKHAPMVFMLVHDKSCHWCLVVIKPSLKTMKVFDPNRAEGRQDIFARARSYFHYRDENLPEDAIGPLTERPTKHKPFSDGISCGVNVCKYALQELEFKTASSNEEFRFLIASSILQAARSQEENPASVVESTSYISEDASTDSCYEIPSLKTRMPLHLQETIRSFDDPSVTSKHKLQTPLKPTCETQAEQSPETDNVCSFDLKFGSLTSSEEDFPELIPIIYRPRRNRKKLVFRRSLSKSSSTEMPHLSPIAHLGTEERNHIHMTSTPIAKPSQFDTIQENKKIAHSRPYTKDPVFVKRSPIAKPAEVTQSTEDQSKPGTSNTVCIDNIGLQITSLVTNEDIDELITPGTKISNLVIDEFARLKISQKEQRNKRIHYIRIEEVRQMMRTPSLKMALDFHQHELILAPIYENDRKHWALLVFQPKKKMFSYVNPMGENKSDVNAYTKTMRQVMAANGIFGTEYQTIKHSRQQKDNDCGVVLMQFIECFCDDTDLEKCSTNTTELRIQYASAILDGKQQANHKVVRTCSMPLNSVSSKRSVKDPFTARHSESPGKRRTSTANSKQELGIADLDETPEVPSSSSRNESIVWTPPTPQQKEQQQRNREHSLNKPVGQMVAYVRGCSAVFDIQLCRFGQAECEVENNIVDTYMSQMTRLQAKKCTKRYKYVLMDDMKDAHMRRLAQDITATDLLFGCIKTPRHHLALVIIYSQKNQWSYIDAAGESTTTDAYLKDFVEKFTAVNGLKTMKFFRKPHPVYETDVSLALLKMTENILKGVQLGRNPMKLDRHEMTKFILENTDDLTEMCALCGVVRESSAPQNSAVACKQCGKWVHDSCVRVGERQVDGSFICTICHVSPKASQKSEGTSPNSFIRSPYLLRNTAKVYRVDNHQSKYYLLDRLKQVTTCHGCKEGYNDFPDDKVIRRVETYTFLKNGEIWTRTDWKSYHVNRNCLRNRNQRFSVKDINVKVPISEEHSTAFKNLGIDLTFKSNID